MKKNIAIISLIFISLSCFAASPNPDVVEKHVRTFIKKGNEAYRAKDYTKAETYYREAISEDKNSSPAYFNLALTLLRKNGNPLKGNTAACGEEAGQKDDSSNPAALFGNVIALNNNERLVTSSYYNMGNIYFEAEKYAESIDQYKNVLRRDPDNIKARQNLRIAQLKLEEQKKNQQNQNQNQQQNKENKEQNQQDKNKDQQQKQNQDKQNQDKNQEKQNKENQQQQKSDESQAPQKQNQGGTSSGKPAMSKENSEKILESARKQEEQTRKKVERRKGERMTRRTTDRPW